MELKEIAAITGRGGLYKIVQPTRTGVILESIDSSATRLVANGNDRVSILNEISIYTTDAEGSKPLDQVLKAIKAKFDASIPVTAKSEPAALKSFLSEVLPQYDENRVYPSDIKKLVSWYLILSQAYPELVGEEKKESKLKKEAGVEEEVAEKSAAKKKAAPKAKTPKKEA
jgi:hypothetical protein